MAMGTQPHRPSRQLADAANPDQARVRERTEERNAKREQYYETRFLTRIEEPGMWETTQP
jgi:hypothetical protein